MLSSSTHTTLQVIFKNLYPQLCVLAYRYLNDLEVSKELVQDVFLNVWEDNIVFENDNHATGYFYKTVKNKCLDYLKCKQSMGREPDVLVNEEAYKSDAFFMSEAVVIETTAVIENALSTLPDKTAQVIRLGIEDYTNNEIADALLISVDRVKGIKKEAYRKLKQLLGFLYFKK